MEIDYDKKDVKVMKNSSSSYLANARLIDDKFFEVVFRKDPKYIEVVIHTIFKQLGRPLVKVQSVSTQVHLSTVEKRDVWLDALAVDEEGRQINIEIQRSLKRKSIVKRARYHSALLDGNTLEAGSDFSELAETYIIFITEKDLRGKGLPAYQVERVFLEDHAPAEDGVHFIFVNGEYKGDDPIGNLMRDFFCRRGEDMTNSVLAERVNFLKETDEGQVEWSDVEAELRAEGREEGKVEKAVEMAKKLILLGKISLETIAEVSGLPLEELRKMKESTLKPA